MSTIPAMQGIVSEFPPDFDLTLPKESRGERLARQKAEAEAKKAEAKAQAKAIKKGETITKAKVSLVDNDQQITYVPEKQVPVIIDLPKIGRFLKKKFSTPKQKITSGLIAFAVMIVAVFGIMSIMQDKQQDIAQTEDNTAITPINIVSNPPSQIDEKYVAPKAKTATKTQEPKKVGIPVPSKSITASAPATPATKPAIATPVTIDHPIEEGETLWDIAVKEYGDGNQWTRIWEANKDVLIANDPRNESDPGHWIHIGQLLTVPK